MYALQKNSQSLIQNHHKEQKAVHCLTDFGDICPIGLLKSKHREYTKYSDMVN